MKRITICCTLVLLILGTASAQFVGLNGAGMSGTYQGMTQIVGGKPAIQSRVTRVVAGTPFFLDNWLPGLIQLGNGEIYSNEQLRLNLMENQLHYMKGEEEMTVAGTISKIQLNDSINGKYYMFWNSQLVNPGGKQDWYRTLTEGKASLFMTYNKVVTQDMKYASAITENTIHTKSHYYIKVNGTLNEIKKWSGLPALLPGKQAEAEAYIKAEGLKGKSEADYMKVVTWYNSLP